MMNFKKIRELYKEAWPILKKEYPRFGINFIGWDQIFTPIERNVWEDIRTLGLPFLPQFPVEKYFIDFADPIKKIGLEVDGQEWHQDKDKDWTRQMELEKLGWKIYRIAGYQTIKTESDFKDGSLEETEEEYFSNNSQGMLTKIRNEFYPRDYENN